jgi:hypothetical protein
MPRSTHILTWLMLAMFVGGHWGMLQVVAWTGMLIDYSRDATFAEAWDKTFSGEHPCAICKTVDLCLADDLGDDERKAPGKLIKTMKLDAVVATMVLVTPTLTTDMLPPTHRAAVSAGMVMEPPRRPPRVLG